MKKLAVVLTALFALTACGGTGPDVSIKGSNSSEAPRSCLAALDMADEAMGIAADFNNAVGAGFFPCHGFHAQNGAVRGIEQADHLLHCAGFSGNQVVRQNDRKRFISYHGAGA